MDRYSDLQVSSGHNSLRELDNDEADQPVYVCRELRGSWAGLWPEMARTG